MITPLANADSLRIGSVEFVAPDEIKVLLDIEAPNDVALNTGVPRPFPRINSYVLISSESGFLVSQIEWITIERSQYPKRKGLQDFGVIDLPYPLRRMKLNPLGVLKEIINDKDEAEYSFSRGVEVFPTVGDPVVLPTQIQLKAIVESGEKRRVQIGISPLAGNAIVSIDPDRLFGRHLAVLGNTGSGKSCSVAGLIHWSLEASERRDKKLANARFIILDPNGEYTHAFSTVENVRLFAVEENKEKNIKQLKVPLWLWNSEEWCAFTQASAKTQRPTLIQALRSVREGQLNFTSSERHQMRQYLRTLVSIVSIAINKGTPWGNFPNNKNFYEQLKIWQSSLSVTDAYDTTEKESLQSLIEKINTLISKHERQYSTMLYTQQEIVELLEEVKKTYFIFGGKIKDGLPISADTPRPFTPELIISSIEANAALMNTSEHVETMLMRVRTLLSDTRMKTITEVSDDLTLEKWLEEYICPSDSVEGAITVIDLSLVPAEIVHIIAAVIARMTLEALQRYRQANNGATLPTTIVMEEAHTFIRRYDADATDNSAMCTKVFEKIAREGRKFGLGLVLSSQRPSELSQTVLSQCNSYLLHRISNDKDQELVNKLVPDNLRGLLRELPTLPSQRAILLGWASELPVMVNMNYLHENQRPLSNDPTFWSSWVSKEQKVEWGNIADNWQEGEHRN